MTLAKRSIRLAERVRKLSPSSTLAVNARIRELKAAGRDVVGFGAGEPDFDTPPGIKQAAVDALLAGQTGYQPVPGPAEIREVIAAKLRDENGIDCTADHIVVNAGAKHSVYLALQALVDPGQEVIVPTPAWVSYLPMTGLCDGVAVEVPGSVENDFRITPTQLADAITPETAAVILNSPSNPCGTMYAPDELRALIEVLEPHEHVVIISDEIYEKLIYGGLKHFSPGSVASIADRVITVNGLSKAYAMTGWRLGYACAPGDGGAIAKAIAKLQGQMNSHATAFCYPAIIDALRNHDGDVERMRQTFAKRAELIHGLLMEMPGIRCPKPTGAFYVFPDISAHFGKTTPGGRTIDSSLAFAEALLEETLVAVVPGDDFGACAKNHIRLSFACSDEHITEGCRRIREWLVALS
jgi:aspartate aminotransferase